MPRKILIVEDEESSAIMMRHALLREFPDSKLLTVKKLREALDIIQSNEPPEFVMLDLTLLDSDREETLARVRDIRAVCPVAIISGHPPEGIAERNPDVPFCEKTDLTKPGFLARVITAAICAWPSRLDDSICRAERLLESPPPLNDQR